MAKQNIPTCPLLTIGQTNEKKCLQEECAWYMQNSRTCAMYVVAHDSILNIKEKQNRK